MFGFVEGHALLWRGGEVCGQKQGHKGCDTERIGPISPSVVASATSQMLGPTRKSTRSATWAPAAAQTTRKPEVTATLHPHKLSAPCLAAALPYEAGGNLPATGSGRIAGMMKALHDAPRRSRKISPAKRLIVLHTGGRSHKVLYTGAAPTKTILMAP